MHLKARSRKLDREREREECEGKEQEDQQGKNRLKGEKDVESEEETGLKAIQSKG